MNSDSYVTVRMLSLLYVGDLPKHVLDDQIDSYMKDKHLDHEITLKKDVEIILVHC